MEKVKLAYPRPQFERENWLSLNGTWDFQFENEPWQFIQVPYAYQAILSGIGDNRPCNHVTYRRRFTVPAAWQGQIIQLNFGAVDYSCEVWLNGQHIGCHVGGNVGFSFDITEALNWEEEEIVVSVLDPWQDETIPRGKQYWLENPEAIWYTRTTGIWQTVWLEPLNPLHIEQMRYIGDIDRGCVEISWEINAEPVNSWIVFDISIDGESLTTLKQQIHESHGTTVIDLFNGHIFRSGFHHSGWCWTPESPKLFDLNVSICNEDITFDTVHSYFGLRKIEAKDGIVHLNNKPYYQKLVLDQGYWPEGLLTAPSDEALKEDILKAKAMGFNGCRKHQKAEDPRFLYWADKLGFLVWSEIGASVSYSIQSVSRLITEWNEAILRDFNHPSIVAWVTVNESWGMPEIARNRQQQALARALYYQCKALDSTRLVVGNDGWEIVISDICAIHNYAHGSAEDAEAQVSFSQSLLTRESLIEKMPANHAIYADGSQYDGAPIMLTEFGGISLKCAIDRAWGYTHVTDTETFIAEYKRILDAVSHSHALCGFCYTQLYDVEQETNGLLTYQREYKVDPGIIRSVNDQVRGFWLR